MRNLLISGVAVLSLCIVSSVYAYGETNGAPLSSSTPQYVPLNSISALKAAGTPAADTKVELSKGHRVMVGDATSSLSREQAIDLAQQTAARIPGAAVAVISSDYTGQFAPEIPCNSVLVIEPVSYADVAPFDVVLFKDPSKALRFRRVMAKGADHALLGFEMIEDQMKVAPEAIVGRKVAIFIYAPVAATQPGSN